MYLSNAYYLDPLQSNSGRIRIIAVGEKKIYDDSLYCRNAKEDVNVIFQSIGHNDHCQWRIYFLDCEFEYKASDLEVYNAINENVVKLAVVQPPERQFNVVVCLNQANLLEDWQMTFHIIEMYIGLGADLLVLPVLNMLTIIIELLKTYEDEGKLRIVKGLLLPLIKSLKYDPNEEIENVAKLLLANECLYAYKHSAKFIIFSDLNELLLPHHGEYFDEFSRLQTRFPQASSFGFNWAISAGPRQSISSYDVTMPLKKVMVREIVGFGTPVVIPNKVDLAFEHSPIRPVDSNNHIRLGRNESWSVKYIFPVYNPALRNISIPLNFSPKIGFYFKIMDKFNQRINSDRKMYKYFQRLPPHLTFFPKMDACLRIQKLRSIPYTCLNQRKCLPAISNTSLKCTVLRRSFHRADFGVGRKFYSELNSNFFSNHSCVFY